MNKRMLCVLDKSQKFKLVKSLVGRLLNCEFVDYEVAVNIIPIDDYPINDIVQIIGLICELYEWRYLPCITNGFHIVVWI